MAEPKSIIELPDVFPAIEQKLLVIEASEWNDVPVLLVRKVVANDIRPLFLHVEANEPTRRPQLQHALAPEIDVS